MKIVQEGNTSWMKQVSCRECRSILEIEESDMFVVNTAVNWAGESWDPVIRVECPVCHHTVNVTNQVPSRLQEKMYDEYRKR